MPHRSADILDTIRKAWGWSGLKPVEVVAMNAFGNLIVRVANGAYWRICPEELSCAQIAANAAGFAALSKEEEFQTDWEMARLVKIARKKIGKLPEGRCYCLKLPAVVGGGYEAKNMGAISLIELISVSGDLARQMKDLPEGAQVEIKIVP